MIRICTVGHSGNRFVTPAGGIAVLTWLGCAIVPIALWVEPDFHIIDHRSGHILKDDEDVVVHRPAAGHVSQDQAIPNLGVGKAPCADVSRNLERSRVRQIAGDR